MIDNESWDDEDGPTDDKVAEQARHGRVSALVKPKRRRRLGRVLFSIVTTLVLLIVLVGGAVYWRMGSSPIAVPFLTDQVLRGIGANLPPGYSASLSGVSMARQETGLVIVLHDFALDGPDGRPLAVARNVAVGLGMAALLKGSVQPRSIVVEGAQAALAIDVKGRIKLLAGQDSQLSVASGLAALDGLLIAAKSIDQVELRDATMRIDDQALGRNSLYQGLSLTIRRTAAKRGFAVSFAVKSGGSVNATIERGEGGARLIDVQARGMSVQEVMRTLSPGTVVPNITAPLEATLASKFRGDGTVEQSSIAVKIGAGNWRVSPDVDPFTFDGAAIDLHWDAAANVFLVDRAMLQSGSGIGNFQGRLIPPPEGAPPEWGVALDAPGMTLAGADPNESPLKLDVATLRGRYNPAIRRLGIDALEFSNATTKVTAQGSVTFVGRAPGFGLAITGSKMPLTALKRLWPFMSAPKARAWFIENVKGGTLESGSVTLAIPPDVLIPVNGKMPPLPDEAVAGDMTLSDTTVRLFDTMPLLKNASARAAFTGRQFHLSHLDGSLTADNGEIIAVREGSFTLPDYEAEPPIQNIVFRANAPIAAITSLMHREPLARSADGLSAMPTQMKGTADIGIRVIAPLMKNPPDGQVDYAVEGALSDVSATLSNGNRFADAKLTLKAGPDSFQVTGSGQFAGVPAAISYKKEGKGQPAVQLKLTVDDATRIKRGFDTGVALTGPVAVTITGQNAKSGPFDVDIDLAAVRIRDFLPGWQKAPGKPSKISMNWIPNDNGGTATDISLDAGTVSLRGDANFASDGALRKISLKTFRLSAGDDAQATVEPMAGGGWKASMRARAFDLRPALRMADRREGGKNADISLDIKIDKATGFGDEVLSGFDFNLETKGPAVQRLEARGKLGNTAIAAVQQPGQNGTSQIVVETADAGSLLRFFDYYSRLQGGTFQAVFAPRMDSTQGIVTVRDFSIANEPALSGFFSQAKSRGANLPGVQEGDSQVKFTEMRLNFSRTPDRLRIVEAKIWGPTVGANVSGDVDYGADRVNIAGTFVPAYALNSLPSRLLPGIGQIFTGGENGGLFAVTFKISGAVASPTLTVNPLSAIAPGFLRKLFEFR